MINLNDESIQKLLNCREIVNRYVLQIDENPNRHHSLSKNMLFELAQVGKFTNPNQFQFFNEAMNILEYDRCYRLRPIRNPNTTTLTVDDFCYDGSGCENRGFVKCMFDPKSLACYNREWGILYVLKHEESELVSEYKQYAQDFNLYQENLALPHPIFCIASHAISPETDMPPNCIGICKKIIETRFDIYWGMERMFKFAKWGQSIRESF